MLLGGGPWVWRAGWHLHGERAPHNCAALPRVVTDPPSGTSADRWRRGHLPLRRGLKAVDENSSCVVQRVQYSYKPRGGGNWEDKHSGLDTCFDECGDEYDFLVHNTRTDSCYVSLDHCLSAALVAAPPLPLSSHILPCTRPFLVFRLLLLGRVLSVNKSKLEQLYTVHAIAPHLYSISHRHLYYNMFVDRCRL